jgi:hypothetical protein
MKRSFNRSGLALIAATLLAVGGNPVPSIRGDKRDTHVFAAMGTPRSDAPARARVQ